MRGTLTTIEQGVSWLTWRIFSQQSCAFTLQFPHRDDTECTIRLATPPPLLFKRSRFSSWAVYFLSCPRSTARLVSPGGRLQILFTSSSITLSTVACGVIFLEVNLPPCSLTTNRLYLSYKVCDSPASQLNWPCLELGPVKGWNIWAAVKTADKRGKKLWDLCSAMGKWFLLWHLWTRGDVSWFKSSLTVKLS